MGAGGPRSRKAFAGGLRCAPVSESARTMISNAVDALPIVADGGALVGLVTSTDLTVLLLESSEPVPVTYRIRPEVTA